MKTTDDFSIVEIGRSMRSAVQRLIDDSWAGPDIAVNGRLWDTRAMPGLAALNGDGDVLGYLLYAFHDGVCEIMVLESLRENAGVGTQLIERVKTIAWERCIRKVIVMTTNDNIRAIRFYQKRGFILRAIRVNMLETSRRLKPDIPLTSIEGIPLRDEIEFEIDL